MAELALALVPKKDGIIEKHGLREYVRVAHSGENVVFKDSFSSIEKNSLGVETMALDDVKSDRLSTKYPIVDPSFLAKTELSWKLGEKNWDGKLITITTPLFAVYSLDSPICTLAVKKFFGNLSKSPLRRKIKSPKNIPQQISSQLIKAFRSKNVDFATMIGVFSKDRDGICFTSTFKGLIPSGVKKEIKKAKKYFGDQIFVIAEAEWESDTLEIDDPLVIGIHKNICYLISEFDTTPIEELVAKNYVKK